MKRSAEGELSSPRPEKKAYLHRYHGRHPALNPSRSAADFLVRYKRPPLPAFDDGQKSWNIFLVDIDYKVHERLAEDLEHKDQATEVPLIRLYGPTEDGNSVMVTVHGFKPYFYIQAPSALLEIDDCEDRFREELERQISYFRSSDAETYDDAPMVDANPATPTQVQPSGKPPVTKDSKDSKDAKETKESKAVKQFKPTTIPFGRVDGKPVRPPEPKKKKKKKPKLKTDSKAEKKASVSSSFPRKVRPNPTAPFVLEVKRIKSQTLFGVQHGKTDFFQITLSIPALVTRCRKILERGLILDDRRFQFPVTYASNVLFPLRFLVDKGIMGSSWITVPAGTYRQRPENTRDKLSGRSQLEIHVWHTDLVVQKTWTHRPPIRQLTFDIECRADGNHFPQASIDPVIMVSGVMCTVEADGFEKTSGILMGIGTYASIGATPAGLSTCPVLSVTTRDQLLENWALFWHAYDPDIVLGHNIEGFDLPYLLEQGRGVRFFSELGRLRERCFVRKRVRKTKAMGTEILKSTHMTGRVVFDTYLYARRAFKLRSYTLQYLSQYFLNSTKDAIHHSQIKTLFDGSPEERIRLGTYCVTDSRLTKNIAKVTDMLNGMVEMSKVVGIPMDFLLQKGQQIRCFSLLMRAALQADLLLPNLPKPPAGEEQEKYGGATVIEPDKNIKVFWKFIITLDFMSLYPSIIMAYNLCYTTLILTEEERQRWSPDQYATIWPQGEGEGKPCHRFLKASARPGLLPEIVRRLVATRRAVKKQMDETKDKNLRAILNSVQNALKIVANSVYGFTGASTGMMPCRSIAESVTTFGRDAIMTTKAVLERHFCMANGFPFDAYVIYGDTDSCMVEGPRTEEEAFVFGHMAKALVDFHFRHLPPLSVDFEKIYSRYELLKKKKYAGVKQTPPPASSVLLNVGLSPDQARHLALERQVLTDAGVRFVYETPEVVCWVTSNASTAMDESADGKRALGDGQTPWVIEQLKKIEVGQVLNGRLPAGVTAIVLGYSLHDVENNAKAFHSAPYTMLWRLKPEEKKVLKGGKMTLDTKGLISVRRDNCQFASRMVTTVLDMLLMKQDLQMAVDYARKQISLLMQGRVDISDLIISKTLSKDDYEGEVLQTVFLRKLVARDKDAAPRVGDRLQFVMVRATKGAKIREQAEDPDYVVRHQCPIDYEYYLEHQVKTPLSQILDPFLPPPDRFRRTIEQCFGGRGPGRARPLPPARHIKLSLDDDGADGSKDTDATMSDVATSDGKSETKSDSKAPPIDWKSPIQISTVSGVLPEKLRWQGIIERIEELFTGDHVRKRVKPVLQAETDLGRHCVKFGTCYGCKSPLETKQIVCRECRDQTDDLLVKLTEEAAQAEYLAARCWTQCMNCTSQRCTNSPADKSAPMLCANTDCPIFYRRHTALIENKRLQDMLALF